MRYLGKYIARLLGKSLTRAFLALPTCVQDLAVSWHINLNSTVQETIPASVTGLLDFDGTDDSVTFASNPDVTGNKTISFSFYSNDNDNNNYLYFVPSTADCLFVGIQSGFGNLSMTIQTSGTTNGYYQYNLNSYVETLCNVVISKSTGIVNSLTVNGSAITPDSIGDFPPLTVGSAIGYDIDNTAYGADTYFWNVNLQVSAYDGRPAGNTNGAWVDTIGAINGTVNGTPTTIDLDTSTSTDIVKDSIGEDTRDVYYGQYLSSGTINFGTGRTGTFDYTDPSTGNTVSSVAMGTAVVVPVNGICDIVTSDGSEYPCVEGVGTVLHDIEQADHIAVTTPVWAETLYGSDHLNQHGYVTKADNDSTFTIEGLLDFDGVDDNVSFSTSPDISGNKIINLKVYLEFTGGSGGIVLITNGTSEDCLYFSRSNLNFTVFGKRNSSGTNSRAQFTLGSEYVGRVLDITIVKSTESITSVTINGDSISLTLDGQFFSYATEAFTIGSLASVSEIENTLIWDLEVQGIGQWQGQPNGNQDSAWVDSIGSINGTVNGSPNTTSIIGQEWETIVDGSPVILDDATLIPLKKKSNELISAMDATLNFTLG